MTNRSPQPRISAGVLILLGTGLLVLVSIALFLLLQDTGEEEPRPVATTDPQVIVNLTQLPQATPLTGQEASQWNDLRASVEACADYSAERRAQMIQHLDWIIDPSDMPPDVILAMGENPKERLVFGMAAYTSIEWRLRDRPPDSCLVPIGRTLNTLLIELGTQPFDLYDQ
jgi:hypothetical protein